MEEKKIEKRKKEWRLRSKERGEKIREEDVGKAKEETERQLPKEIVKGDSA